MINLTINSLNETIDIPSMLVNIPTFEAIKPPMIEDMRVSYRTGITTFDECVFPQRSRRVVCLDNVKDLISEVERYSKYCESHINQSFIRKEELKKIKEMISNEEIDNALHLIDDLLEQMWRK